MNLRMIAGNYEQLASYKLMRTTFGLLMHPKFIR